MTQSDNSPVQLSWLGEAKPQSLEAVRRLLGPVVKDVRIHHRADKPTELKIDCEGLTIHFEGEITSIQLQFDTPKSKEEVPPLPE